MNDEKKTETALNQLLLSATQIKASQQLHEQVLRSFAPYSHENKVSLSAILEIIFGQNQHKNALAIACVLAVMVIGGIGGYAGTEVFIEQQNAEDFISSSFASSSFILEMEEGT